MQNLNDKCTACAGKGYATRAYDIMGSDDFGGEGFTKRGNIEKRTCSRCQGTGKNLRYHDLRTLTKVLEAMSELCNDVIVGRIRKPEGEVMNADMVKGYAQAMSDLRTIIKALTPPSVSSPSSLSS